MAASQPHRKPAIGGIAVAANKGVTVYKKILYAKKRGVARITINRPERYNASCGKTVDELIHAFQRGGWNSSVGAIVLTCASDKAFCTGGDQTAHEGRYDGRRMIGLPVEELHALIRDVPEPIVVRANGLAIGGGNVLNIDLRPVPRFGQGVVWPSRAQSGLCRPGLWYCLPRKGCGRRVHARLGNCAATRLLRHGHGHRAMNVEGDMSWTI